MTLRRWDVPGYDRIAAVVYEGSARQLTVTFEDGTRVVLSVSGLPAERHGARWAEAVVEEGVHIHVPVAPGEGDLGTDSTDIPWDALRVLTDVEFAAYLARQAEESARHVGERIRALRKKRGLTARELGERVGMPRQHISRIETGRHSPSYVTLEKIFAAMGCTVRDVGPSAQSEGGDRASA